MNVRNIDIANIFYKLADLLEIDGENQFRIRVYRNAALNIENLPQDISEMVKKGEDLTLLPGIGEDLADKINDIVNNKELELLKNLEEKIPVDFTNLTRIQGLGPRKIKKLYDELGIKNVEELKLAAEQRQIRDIIGFSIKAEEHI